MRNGDTGRSDFLSKSICVYVYEHVCTTLGKILTVNNLIKQNVVMVNWWDMCKCSSNSSVQTWWGPLLKQRKNLFIAKKKTSEVVNLWIICCYIV